MTTPSLAAEFFQIPLPGSTCLDGKPYSYFYRPGDPRKLMIYLQGGGACWDKESCFGLAPKAKIPLRYPESGEGILSQRSDFRDWTLVAVPYCTGDMFLGKHEAFYGKKKARHFGRANFERVLQDAFSRGVDPQALEAFTFYGASAGAIGVMVNMDLADHYFGSVPERRVIVDSPGLHYRDDLWNRFSDAYLSDIQQALEGNGIRFVRNSGLVAAELPGFCKKYPHWDIGFLQGTRDFIMGVVFGNLSKEEHERLVLGPRGMAQTLADPSDNCSSWTPKSASHVFLTSAQKSGELTEDGVSAVDFQVEVMDQERELLSHR